MNQTCLSVKDKQKDSSSRSRSLLEARYTDGCVESWVMGRNTRYRQSAKHKDNTEPMKSCHQSCISVPFSRVLLQDVRCVEVVYNCEYYPNPTVPLKSEAMWHSMHALNRLSAAATMPIACTYIDSIKINSFARSSIDLSLIQ
jgi:reverse gyrase